jgi:hypothetical protein
MVRGIGIRSVGGKCNIDRGGDDGHRPLGGRSIDLHAVFLALRPNSP